MAEDKGFRASDMMKKILTIGVGTFFLTEETLRSLLSEFKLPKEVVKKVLDSANTTRKEFMQSFSQDTLNKIMERVDVRDLVQDVLEKNEIDLQIKVRFNSVNKSSSGSSETSKTSSVTTSEETEDE